MTITIENIIRKHQENFYPVVSFDPKKQRLAPIDLTANNTDLTADIFNDTELFSEYIEKKRKNAKAAYLIGGYNELRAVYGRSALFNGKQIRTIDTFSNSSAQFQDTAQTYLRETDELPFFGREPEVEPRRLHLGIDIWGPAGTPIYAPMGAMIHSFAFNNHYGDYGATLILSHQLDGFTFYTLYGHLSLKDIEHISAGHYVNRGQEIAHFGEPQENGHWPPHLHFQIIIDMELYEGDYPGVCRYSEREKYLANCPDPDVMLKMNRWIS